MRKNKILLILIFFNLQIKSVNKDIDLYFCTAVDEKYFDRLLNLIGSLHKTNFNNTKEIAVFNIGLNKDQLNLLNKIEKIKVYEVEKIHPDILTQFKTTNWGKTVPGWYAFKPVVIKQCIDMFPYVLWIDAGMTVLKPLDNLFKYIQQNGHFLMTVGDDIENNIFKHNVKWQTTKSILDKYNIHNLEKSWILYQESICASIIGVSKKMSG